jgi:hypothetical protein
MLGSHLSNMKEEAFGMDQNTPYDCLKQRIWSLTLPRGRLMNRACMRHLRAPAISHIAQLVTVMDENHEKDSA